MAGNATEGSAADVALARDLLGTLDTLSGGIHPGFRPVHAKGVMYAGTFTPAAGAAGLTRAPHAARESTPVVVRFSPAAGVPTVADNDVTRAGPRGIAIRFFLADHVHTDVIGHSHDGFPVRTGEQFLEMLRAAAASGPGAADPPPIASFLAAHPTARRFVEAPKPIPTSYAREAYFAVTAFKFTNADGVSRAGRFRVRPEAGTEYLSAEDAGKKSPDFLTDELADRLAKGPVRFRVTVQLAGDGDVVTDATVRWPETRPEVEFGTVSLATRVNEQDPEMRKIIFDPVPRVDGIDPAGDPLTDVRSAIYLLSGRRRRAAK